jgi:hypothetical protein
MYQLQQRRYQIMKAIVYQSNSGHAQRYAELFSAKTGLPVYELKSASQNIAKGDDIVFFGWICAGSMPGFSKAAKKYQVRAFCAVGMGRPDGKQISDLAKKYNIASENAFYLQGGLDFKKLHGIYKIMMSTVSKFMGPSLEKKEGKSDEDIEILTMLKDGGDFVREENLAPVLSWLKVH